MHACVFDCQQFVVQLQNSKANTFAQSIAAMTVILNINVAKANQNVLTVLVTHI